MSDQVIGEDRFNKYFERIAETIEEYGWAAQGVGGSKEEPAFVYTVGMYQLERPEFIIFGLNFGTAHSILSTMVERTVNGEEFTNGQEIDGVVVGYPIRLMEVEDTSQHLTVANKFSGHATTAWQIHFPDEKGRWVWEPECSYYRVYPTLGKVES